MPIQTMTAGSRILARAARRFADRTNVLDDPLRLGGFNVDQWAISEELVDCALTAVVCSQATVEASINELFTQGIINDTDHWFAGLDPKIAQNLHRAWPDLERARIEDKIPEAARVAGFRTFTFGAGAAQQLTKLIILRNVLVHRAPEWVELKDVGAQSGDPLERCLGTSFPRARIWQNRKAAYQWDGCLGGPCAVWAYNTAVAFLGEFFRGLGTGYPVEHSKIIPLDHQGSSDPGARSPC